VSALGDVVAAVEPSISPYAHADPSPGEWEGRLEDPHRAFTMEAVHEGFLMHYGDPRAFTGMDADLRLLAGDALYALGLDRLAEQGDLTAVAELADLISLCAQAQAEGRAESVRPLWDKSVARLAHSPLDHGAS
jgi:hypothetical protein